MGFSTRIVGEDFTVLGMPFIIIYTGIIIGEILSFTTTIICHLIFMDINHTSALDLASLYSSEISTTHTIDFYPATIIILIDTITTPIPITEGEEGPIARIPLETREDLLITVAATETLLIPKELDL